MSRPNASRRQLFGAGAALLLLAPAAIGTAKAAEIDGELLDLCADLEKRQAEVKRVAADPTDGDMVKLDVALDDWWCGFRRSRPVIPERSRPCIPT